MKRVTATFVTLLLSVSMVYSQTNVDGEWTVYLTLPLGEAMFTMNVVQKGEKLSGYMLSDSGQFELEGAVSGDRIKVQWSFPDGGTPVTVIFNGQISGNRMSGTAKVGNVGEGSMTAQRK